MSIQAKVLTRTLRFILPKWLREEHITASRSTMEKFTSKLKIPSDVTQTFVNIEGLLGEWIAVPGAYEDRVLLYLHGGGYLSCSVNTHRHLIIRLCRVSGMQSLAINYRLAPEYPFPAALEDSTSAYRWLLAKGISPWNIIIAGDSAGGGLTLATLISLRDSGIPLPAGAVCLSPWTDLAGTGDSITNNAKTDYLFSKKILSPARLYAGEYDLKHPLISPLYANLHGLPPLFIQVGSDEILLDDSTRLTEHAQAAGVTVTLEIWDGMMHVFQAFAMLIPEGKKAIKKIGTFIQDCIENQS